MWLPAATAFAVNAKRHGRRMQEAEYHAYHAHLVYQVNIRRLTNFC